LWFVAIPRYRLVTELIRLRGIYQGHARHLVRIPGGVRLHVQAAETSAHGDLGGLAILGGGLAIYLLAVSFIHWVNRGSLDDHALFARLATAALLILLVPLGAFISPLIFRLSAPSPCSP
jgi:hypothetical protein